MLLKKDIKAGRVKIFLFGIIFSLFLINSLNLAFSNDLEGNFTNIKILDKISSKNTLVKLKNGNNLRYKDLSIKSLKCKNSEFDDNPEITAYIQVKDLTNKDKNDVFVFNGRM